VTKVVFKIESHYGNKDLKTIIENLLSIKLSNLQFNSKDFDKSNCNNDTYKKAIHQETSEQ